MTWVLYACITGGTWCSLLPVGEFQSLEDCNARITFILKHAEDKMIRAKCVEKLRPLP